MKYYSNNDSVISAYLCQSSADGRNGNESLYFKGDFLYSYGYHFPLAVRNFQGRYIINADKYSVTTSAHQNNLIGRIREGGKVEIPYSALGNISSDHGEYTKIEIVDWVADRWIDTGRFNRHGNAIYDHELGAALINYDDRQFISSIDPSGRGRLYFLTELSGKADTVEEALELLKPPEVREAEANDLAVLRQGEWFFVPTPINPKDYVRCTNKAIAIFKPATLHNRDEGRLSRHYATEGFTVHNRRFVRGTVRHKADEHKLLRLYETGTKPNDRIWYEAFENVQLNSWSANGDVD